MKQSITPDPRDIYVAERVKRLSNLNETYREYNMQLEDFTERSLAHAELDLNKLKGLALDVIIGKKQPNDLVTEILTIDFDIEAVDLMISLKIWEE